MSSLNKEMNKEKGSSAAALVAPGETEAPKVVSKVKVNVTLGMRPCFGYEVGGIGGITAFNGQKGELLDALAELAKHAVLGQNGSTNIPTATSNTVIFAKKLEEAGHEFGTALMDDAKYRELTHQSKILDNRIEAKVDAMTKIMEDYKDSMQKEGINADYLQMGQDEILEGFDEEAAAMKKKRLAEYKDELEAAHPKKKKKMN